MKLIHVNQEGVDMSIVTETKKGEKKVYEVNPKEIRQIALAKAEGEAAIIKNVFKAMKESEIDDNMLALKSMEALEKIAESDSTKLVLPSDTVNFLGSFKGIKEVLSNDKLQNK